MGRIKGRIKGEEEMERGDRGTKRGWGEERRGGEERENKTGRGERGEAEK